MLRGCLYISEYEAKEPGTSQLDHYIPLHDRMYPQAISQDSALSLAANDMEATFCGHHHVIFCKLWGWPKLNFPFSLHNILHRQSLSVEAWCRFRKSCCRRYGLFNFIFIFNAYIGKP